MSTETRGKKREKACSPSPICTPIRRDCFSHVQFDSSNDLSCPLSSETLAIVQSLTET